VQQVERVNQIDFGPVVTGLLRLRARRPPPGR
jgi:hypothetical protein